jgi:hypothetical protein
MIAESKENKSSTVPHIEDTKKIEKALKRRKRDSVRAHNFASAE